MKLWTTNLYSSPVKSPNFRCYFTYSGPTHDIPSADIDSGFAGDFSGDHRGCRRRRETAAHHGGDVRVGALLRLESCSASPLRRPLIVRSPMTLHPA